MPTDLLADLALIASTVAGHTKPQAGRVLAALAGLVPADQAIVELGVFKGRSACYLGAGARAGNGAHVYAVDPWDLPGERYPYHWLEARPSRHAFTKPETREEAEANVARLGLGEQVTLVREFSATAGADYRGAPVGLLHVDGDHRADAVRNDFAAWAPHLAPDARVLFDDHVPTCRDVMVVVSELVRDGRITPVRQRTRRLAVARFLR